MAIPVQRRADTAANWTSVNPILIQRQQGFETDTLKWKLGDGVTAWNSLPYFSGGSGTGDVVGPASATDNAIARFDGTTGKIVQNSAATIADTSGDITAGKYNTVAISGSSTPTLAVTGTVTISGTHSGTSSGTNTGDQTNITGNAGTATALQTGRTINGTTFNGTANITITADPNAHVHAAADITSGTIATARLGSGTANSSTFLRGDQTWATVSGTGDFVGPGSSTDNAVVRFDGTTGKLGQNSAVTIADTTGDITAGKYNTVAISGSSTPTLAVTGTTAISGTNTGDQNLFSTIAVSGQSNVVADSASDTLTLVAGSNVTITTNASTDEITIAASGGGGGNSFETIAVSGQSDVVADSSTDTLTLVAGTNVTITTNAATDAITINSSQTNITGNAGTATALQTGRTINGTTFDGTANITVAAAAGTLTGSTLAAGVTASSLTSVGTITSGTWNGTQLSVFYGGTGAGTFTDGGVLVGNSTGAIQATSAGTAGQVLISGGAGVDPAFGAVPSHNHAASDITSGTVATARLGSGTANSSTYLRGDQTWASVSGSGDVVGPASATDAVPALFDGTTGKLLKNSTPTGTGNPVLHNGPTLAVPHADSWILDGSISGTAVLQAHPSSGTTTYFIVPPTTGNSGQILTTDGTGQTSWTSTPTLGAASGTTGSVLFKGTTSGTVTFTVASAAGTHTIKLPTADGSANQVLKTDGSGQWGWVTPSAGSVATDTIWNAAGDLAYGTGSDTATVLSIGDSMAKLYNNGSAPFWGTANNTWTIEEHFFGVSSEVFSYSNSGGSNNFLSAQANADHPGVLRLGATNSGNYAGIIIGGSTGWLTFGGGEAIFEGSVYIENLSDGTDSYAMRIGFIESAAGTQVDGVFLLHDHNNSNWQVQCRTASTGSASASNTAVATGWTKVKVVVSAAGTSAAFYINGTQLNVSPLTSNIPTSTNMTAVGGQINKTFGTTVRYVHFDYMRATGKLTNPL